MTDAIQNLFAFVPEEAEQEKEMSSLFQTQDEEEYKPISSAEFYEVAISTMKMETATSVQELNEHREDVFNFANQFPSKIREVIVTEFNNIGRQMVGKETLEIDSDITIDDIFEEVSELMEALDSNSIEQVEDYQKNESEFLQVLPKALQESINADLEVHKEQLKTKESLEKMNNKDVPFETIDREGAFATTNINNQKVLKQVGPSVEIKESKPTMESATVTVGTETGPANGPVEEAKEAGEPTPIVEETTPTATMTSATVTAGTETGPANGPTEETQEVGEPTPSIEEQTSQENQNPDSTVTFQPKNDIPQPTQDIPQQNNDSQNNKEDGKAQDSVDQVSGKSKFDNIPVADVLKMMENDPSIKEEISRIKEEVRLTREELVELNVKITQHKEEIASLEERKTATDAAAMATVTVQPSIPKEMEEVINELQGIGKNYELTENDTKIERPYFGPEFLKMPYDKKDTKLETEAIDIFGEIDAKKDNPEITITEVDNLETAIQKLRNEFVKYVSFPS